MLIHTGGPELAKASNKELTHPRGCNSRPIQSQPVARAGCKAVRAVERLDQQPSQASGQDGPALFQFNRSDS